MAIRPAAAQESQTCENPKRTGPKSTQVIVQQELPVIKTLLETIVTCLFWNADEGKLGPKKSPLIGPKLDLRSDLIQKSP